MKSKIVPTGRKSCFVFQDSLYILEEYDEQYGKRKAQRGIFVLNLSKALKNTEHSKVQIDLMV